VKSLLACLEYSSAFVVVVVAVVVVIVVVVLCKTEKDLLVSLHRGYIIWTVVK